MLLGARKRRLQQAQGAPGADADAPNTSNASGADTHEAAYGEEIAMEVDRDTGSASLPMGLADIDPEPLTQISAEAIDPDATQAAHDDLFMQRERLPIPGKNLP